MKLGLVGLGQLQVRVRVVFFPFASGYIKTRMRFKAGQTDSVTTPLSCP